MVYRSAKRALMSVSAIALAAGAAAQDGPVVLNEIIVEGELQSRTLQDTTTSVAVITGEELEERSDFDLYDVIERTPGVYSAFGEKGFSIRGIDQRGVGGGGNGLLVSTTVDGATVSNSNQLTFFGPYSNWDLEQIEILRGPQSTQTGRNALAGAVVIRSKDPTYENEVKGRIEGGDRNTIGGSFALNVPFAEDGLAFRFSVDARETDGYVENPTLNTDEYDARRSLTLRAAMLWEPTDDIDAVLKFTHAENFGGEDFVEASLFPGERVNFSNEEATEGAIIDSINLRLGYDVNDALRLESETTYFDADYERFEDFDFSAVPTGGLFRNSDIKNFQQEVKLLYDGETFSGVIGAFYTDISDVAPAGGVIPASFVNPDFAVTAPGATIRTGVSRDTQTENFAFFGEGEYRVTPQIGLIAGLRYDNETIDLTSTNAFTSDNPIVQATLPPATVEQSRTSFDAFLPKFGVVYDATDDLSFGLTAQRGYRSGGTSVNLFTGVRNEFDPEKTWNYEFSVRSQWFDQRLTVNANVFYTQWTNQQVNVLGPSGNPTDSSTLNVGDSELYGGEIEIRALPIDGLEVFASAAFVETEFKDFVTGPNDFSGNEFPFAPKFSASAGATYFFENGFYLGGDVSYTDDAFNDAANSPIQKLDDRFLVNARVGYRDEAGWEVFAYARNLFDEDYITGAAEDGAGNLQRVRAGEPFTVGLVGRVRF